MLVRGVTGRYERDTVQADCEVVPHREIIGWQGECECGWQGLYWERVASPEETDFSQRKAFVTLGGPTHAPEPVDDDRRCMVRARRAPRYHRRG